MEISEQQNLKRLGLRATLPRLRVLELLMEEGMRHVTAEDLYRRMVKRGEEIGLATIYRVLMQFEAAGLVIRHHFGSNVAVYELNRGKHHNHIMCTRCGEIAEFMDGTIEKRLDALVKRRELPMTGQIADHKLTVYVHCDKEECKHRK